MNKKYLVIFKKSSHEIYFVKINRTAALRLVLSQVLTYHSSVVDTLIQKEAKG
jgi:hypothetical protein